MPFRHIRSVAYVTDQYEVLWTDGVYHLSIVPLQTLHCYPSGAAASDLPWRPRTGVYAAALAEGGITLPGTPVRGLQGRSDAVQSAVIKFYGLLAYPDKPPPSAAYTPVRGLQGRSDAAALGCGTVVGPPSTSNVGSLSGTM